MLLTGGYWTRTKVPQYTVHYITVQYSTVQHSTDHYPRCPGTPGRSAGGSSRGGWRTWPSWAWGGTSTAAGPTPGPWDRRAAAMLRGGSCTHGPGRWCWWRAGRGTRASSPPPRSSPAAAGGRWARCRQLCGGCGARRCTARCSCQVLVTIMNVRILSRAGNDLCED